MNEAPAISPRSRLALVVSYGRTVLETLEATRWYTDRLQWPPEVLLDLLEWDCRRLEASVLEAQRG